MNYSNRRLLEIRSEKQFFKSLLYHSINESEKGVYKSKLELLENEEKDILKRCEALL